MSDDLRYPIGRFNWPENMTPADRAKCIDRLAQLPARLRLATAGMSETQLATPYRDGGWTVRQVVHHLADTNLNTFGRMKLALTENEPLVTKWNEAAWAELPDIARTPIE